MTLYGHIDMLIRGEMFSLQFNLYRATSENPRYSNPAIAFGLKYTGVSFFIDLAQINGEPEGEAILPFNPPLELTIWQYQAPGQRRNSKRALPEDLSLSFYNEEFGQWEDNSMSESSNVWMQQSFSVCYFNR